MKHIASYVCQMCCDHSILSSLLCIIACCILKLHTYVLFKSNSWILIIPLNQFLSSRSNQCTEVALILWFLVNQCLFSRSSNVCTVRRKKSNVACNVAVM